MIQWIIVALVLAACLGWIIWRLTCRKRNGGCCNCGCDTCPHNEKRHEK